MTDYCLKPDYNSRSQVEYFDNSIAATTGVIHQPYVYPFAAYLAKQFGCSHIIDIGCGHAEKLVQLSSEFKLIGIDYGDNIRYCQNTYKFGQWIEYDLNSDTFIAIDNEIVKNSVIICADVIEHLINPTYLLKNLKRLLDDAPVVLLSTPERDLVRGVEDFGPPANPYHVREWNLPELEAWLSAEGFQIAFSGLTVNNSQNREKKTALVILENNQQPPFLNAPPDFRVVAIMNTYNEADIIAPSLQRLFSQGIEVYLIDNWSTDDTFELANPFLGRGLIGLERYPANGPAKYWSWGPQLHRVEEICQTLDADWFIHHDVDEERDSPWPEVNLKDAIYYVDRCGFNCIDHTVINFFPIDNSYQNSTSLGEHFKYYEFGKRSGHFLQIKAWKNLGQPVSLAAMYGHQVQFEQAQVYPYKFLLRHYPIRSQVHGLRKNFIERKERVDPQEKAQGANTHYDLLEANYNFIRNPLELEFYDIEAFNKYYLVERLSGIGIIEGTRNPETKEIHQKTSQPGCPLICETPNQFARPANLELDSTSATIHGYQEFVLTKDTIQVLAEDLNLKKKQELLAPYFKSGYLKSKTILDLGANAGFFGYWGLQQGADQATCIEMDPQYVELVQTLNKHFSITNLKVFQVNVADWDQPADVVLALALVHWLFSCTTLLGSLSKVIEKLSALTNDMLIVEWIAPEDPAIDFFHHLDWNQEVVQDAYTQAAFETAMAANFARFEILGSISDTRKLYIAFRHPLIDISTPLPLLKEAHTLIYSRKIATIDGVEYWSRVYDDSSENLILKQASFDLARHEYDLLRQLDSPYFPKALSSASEPEYSTILLEKINGTSLRQAVPEICASRALMRAFFTDCLELLSQLQAKGIQHRDIRPDNILVRQQKPVLIDFGWAVADSFPYPTPHDLNFFFRPANGKHCDVYSMGKVLAQINQGIYPEVEAITKLMTEEDPSLRLTDLAVLKTLLHLAFSLPENQEETGFNQTGLTAPPEIMEESGVKYTITHLFDSLLKYSTALALLQNQTQQQEAAIRQQEATIQQQQTTIQQQQTTIQQQQTTIQQQQTTIQQQQATIQQLVTTLNDIYQTRFWRLAKKFWGWKQGVRRFFWKKDES